MGRAWLVVAAVAAGAYLCGLALDLSLLRTFTKPVPALCLAAWSLTGADRYARWIAAGLLLSAAGDFALDRGVFVGGLAAFLCAHLLYLTAFVADTRAPRLVLGLPFLVYGLAATAFLWPGLGAMRAPVAVYVTAICAMLWRAAARLGVSPRGRLSAQAALSGAIVFAMSDSLIAFDRFHAPIPHAAWPIMILYWLGQLGIASSAQV